ncbi:hypothetical protein MHYP_G00335060 [Metynnis hypsauchen]
MAAAVAQPTTERQTSCKITEHVERRIITHPSESQMNGLRWSMLMGAPRLNTAGSVLLVSCFTFPLSVTLSSTAVGEL